MSFGNHLVNIHRKPTRIYGPGRDHTLELYLTLKKAKGRLSEPDIVHQRIKKKRKKEKDMEA